MKKRLTQKTIELRLPNYIKLDWTTYINSHIKCKFIDKDFGEFWAVPKDVWNDHGHRKRGNLKLSEKKKIKIKEILKRLPEWLILDISTYKNTFTKAKFKNKLNKKIYWILPKHVFKYSNKKNKRIGNSFLKNVRLSLNDVKKRLPNNVSLVENTFKNVMTKCLFVDNEFGEFWKRPNDLFRGSQHPLRAKLARKQTNLLKYGFEHPFQNREIMLKAKRSCKRSYVLKHWKTKEKIICTGNYEKNVVKFLNKNKIDFDWQIPFKLTTGKTYFCDLFLKKENKYVEIKGYWQQKISEEKWEEFHKNYSNSELWDQNRLKLLGIATREKT